MTILRPFKHPVTSESGAEIWRNGECIGAIYPTKHGVRIESEHIERRDDLVVVQVQTPVALIVNLLR